MNREFRYPETCMILRRKYAIFRYPKTKSSDPTASSDIIQKSAGGYVPRIRTTGTRSQPRECGPDIETHFYRTGCLCPSAVARALPRHRNSSPATQAPRTGARIQAAPPVTHCVPPKPAPKPSYIPSHGGGAHRDPPKHPTLAPVRATWVTGLFKVISPQLQ